MSDFVVYTIPGSPFARAVLATLEEKGQAWRLAPVAPGAHRQPPHIHRHPFARVPVLEHDDFRLYETQAILRYLDRLLPEPPLTPSDPRDAARMDLLMGVSDWYLFHGVGNVIGFERIIKPRFSGAPPDESACAAAMPKARIVFDEIATRLGGSEFLVGSSLTLADLMVAPHMSFLAMTPEWGELAHGHENLVAWLARMEARPSFAATTWARLSELAKAQPA